MLSGVFLLLAACCWPIAFLEYEHTRHYPIKRTLPVVSGIVEDRYFVPFSFMKRPVLVIRPDGTNITVKALLISDGMFDFPSRLEFHYSGDPKEEVLLVGEDSGYFPILFMTFSPILLPGFVAFVILLDRLLSKRTR
jgi:hypothetical protein